MRQLIFPLFIILTSCFGSAMIEEPNEKQTISQENTGTFTSDPVSDSEDLPPFAETKLSTEEEKLYNGIMAYRQENNLPKIPLSKSLTFVAQSHCHDLFNNKPDVTEECNAHSWSDKGAWTSCCYTKDHKQASCMWNKPGELTPYKHTGFEIACGQNDNRLGDFVMTADFALKSWQGSSGHNAVIMNQAPWDDNTWNAIGIGIYKGFAMVWFGTQTDTEGEPTGQPSITQENPVTIISDPILVSDDLPLFADTKLSTEEVNLYNIIMAYRAKNNLPKIPLSKSLTFVAQHHCHDLYNNKPDVTEECNAHSWSDKGTWTGCCYTKDHKQASCIWNKPGELTSYKSYGFEIGCGQNDNNLGEYVMTADYALKSWQGSPAHNALIMNQAPWNDYKWNAIGIGIYKGFAMVWFGTEVDAEGEPLK